MPFLILLACGTAFAFTGLVTFAISGAIVFGKIYEASGQYVHSIADILLIGEIPLAVASCMLIGFIGYAVLFMRGVTATTSQYYAYQRKRDKAYRASRR